MGIFTKDPELPPPAPGWTTTTVETTYDPVTGLDGKPTPTRPDPDRSSKPPKPDKGYSLTKAHKPVDWREKRPIGDHLYSVLLGGLIMTFIVALIVLYVGVLAVLFGASGVFVGVLIGFMVVFFGYLIGETLRGAW